MELFNKIATSILFYFGNINNSNVLFNGFCGNTSYLLVHSKVLTLYNQCHCFYMSLHNLIPQQALQDNGASVIPTNKEGISSRAFYWEFVFREWEEWDSDCHRTSDSDPNSNFDIQSMCLDMLNTFWILYADTKV